MRRTDRQERITGWDQDGLESQAVGIIGSGSLAEFAVAYCAGLGTRKLVIIDNQEGQGLFLKGDSGKRVHNLEKRVKDPVSGLNPDIDVQAYDSVPVDYLLDGCAVVADLTNRKHIKESSRKIASSLPSCRTYISASAAENAFQLSVKNTASRYKHSLEDIVKKNTRTSSRERILKEVKGNRDCSSNFSYDGAQGAVPGSIGAALVAEEIRRTLMPLDVLGDRRHVRDREFSYNLLSSNRLQRSPDCSLDLKRIRKKDVLVVGAGGTGTYAALNLALLGVRSLTIADPDNITVSNLNRQMLYTLSDVGMNKANVISRRLGEISPRVKMAPIPDVVGQDSAINYSRFDLVYLCVDNPGSRKDLSTMAVWNQVPVIDAGVSPFRANVSFYMPGRTPCLNCQNSYSGQGFSRSTGCADAGDPSIVVTNALAGSLMVAESLPILCSQKDVKLRQFYYSSYRHDDYISIIEPRNRKACDCRRKNEAA